MRKRKLTQFHYFVEIVPYQAQLITSCIDHLMEVKVVLFLIFCLLKSTLGVSETCTEQCKLLVEGNVFTAEFQSKSSEDGVRMVYLHLNVGNESYNPLQSRDRFLPNRWTWTRAVEEPMLFLSLGLLKNQVRNMEVTLTDEPRGCVASLTSSCKDIIVTTTLLKKVTDASTDPSLSGDVVCVSVVKRDMNWLAIWFEGNIQYHCCKQEQNGNETAVQCDHLVQYNRWYMLFYHVLTFGIIVLFFFWPAVIPWLQKQSDDAEINKNQIAVDDAKTGNDEIPVDDLSPISCRILWQRYRSKYRRTEEEWKQEVVDRMIASYYIYVLLYAYILLALNYALFMDYLTEADAKGAFPENALFYHIFDIRSSKLYCLIPVIVFFIVLPANFFFFIACATKKNECNISTKMIKNMYVLRKRVLNLYYKGFILSPRKRMCLDIISSKHVVNYLKK